MQELKFSFFVQFALIFNLTLMRANVSQFRISAVINYYVCILTTTLQLILIFDALDSK